MGRLSYNQLRDFLEVAGAGISLGALTNEFIVTFTLTILALMPTANRWAERWFSHDLQSDV